MHGLGARAEGSGGVEAAAIGAVERAAAERAVEVERVAATRALGGLQSGARATAWVHRLRA